MKRRRTRKRRHVSALPAGIQVGASVVVRSGVLDPDFGIDIGGWQGQVVQTGQDPESGATICIEWDSVTLRQMPESTIAQSEEQGLDWKLVWLGANEIEVTTPRDMAEDVAEAQRQIAAQSTWLWLGEEQGRRVQEVLADIDEDDEVAAFEAWARYLRRKLTFPFEAEVSEQQEYGPLRAGDRVTVRRIIEADDFYGVIVQVVKKGLTYPFPLCDLEAADRNSPNYQCVDDYSVWFANR